MHESTPMFVRIALALPVKETFDYAVPAHLLAGAMPGARVLVPFGRQRVTGYILEALQETEPHEIKEILEVLDPEPLLPETWFREFRIIVVGMTALTAGFFFFIISFVMKTKRMEPKIKIIQGRKGEVIEKLDPEGEVKVRGELWKAKSHDGVDIEPGEDIEVVDREGLTLIVKRFIQTDEENASNSEDVQPEEAVIDNDDETHEYANKDIDNNEIEDSTKEDE